MLGFVLTAEENRRKGVQTKTSSESEQQEDISTTIAGPVPERVEKDESLFTSTYGYFESNGEQGARLWTPLEYADNIQERSKTASTHRKVATCLSYDAWLEKKQQAEKEAKSHRPTSAITMRSKVGRELDDTAFKEWLEGKKKFRKRSKSETLTIEHHRSGSGVPYEEWLRQKRQQLNGKLLLFHCK